MLLVNTYRRIFSNRRYQVDDTNKDLYIYLQGYMFIMYYFIDWVCYKYDMKYLNDCCIYLHVNTLVYLISGN